MGVSNGHACHIKKNKAIFFNYQINFRGGNNILLKDKEITEKLY